MTRMYEQQTLIGRLHFTKINWFFKSDWLIPMSFQGQQRCPWREHVALGKIRFCVCEGSRVILLTLDEHRSWRVGRIVPMIRSAVLTTLRSLLRSDLVAELNQTDVDLQRTDSMMADRTVSAAPVADCTSSAGEGSTASAGPFSQLLFLTISTNQINRNNNKILLFH